MFPGIIITAPELHRLSTLQADRGGASFSRAARGNHDRQKTGLILPVASPSLRSGQAPRASRLLIPVGRTATKQSAGLAARAKKHI